MKYIFVTIFVGLFVATPMYLLNTLVMPELQGLQQTYVSAGAVADRIANQSATTH